eukprot:SAG22_NODE_725_length_7622_cov_1.958926_7_plen_260_part_00
MLHVAACQPNQLCGAVQRHALERHGLSAFGNGDPVLVTGHFEFVARVAFDKSPARTGLYAGGGGGGGNGNGGGNSGGAPDAGGSLDVRTGPAAGSKGSVAASSAVISASADVITPRVQARVGVRVGGSRVNRVSCAFQEFNMVEARHPKQDAAAAADADAAAAGTARAADDSGGTAAGDDGDDDGFEAVFEDAEAPQHGSGTGNAAAAAAAAAAAEAAGVGPVPAAAVAGASGFVDGRSINDEENQLAPEVRPSVRPSG